MERGGGNLDFRTLEVVDMGFRFRRSFKLIPGLRLNLGLGGASLSAGVPGAMLNFSRRGARTTFGIPGTGFSWSQSTSSGRLPARYRPPLRPGETQPINNVAELEEAIRDPRAKVVYRGSGRRLSPQQIEALYRRLANEERKEQAQAEVDKMEADLAEQLACWRDMPTVPSPDDYRAALKQQPFKFEKAAPTPPNLVAVRADLEDALRATVEAETPLPSALPVVGVGAGGLIGAAVLLLIGGASGTVAASADSAAAGVASAGSVLAAGAVALVALVAAGVLHGVRRSRRVAAVNEETLRRADAAWPGQKAEVNAAHAEAIAVHERERARAEAEWLESERVRIAWAARLVGGDAEAVEEAVSDSLQDLDFPFETEAEFGIETAQEGYLHLDLPEIEDVVPTTRHRLLADGRLKEVKRDEAERNEEYTELVCGVGLMMASAAFAAAPTLAVIHIAAYTQREQKGRAKGHVDDDYVYVASIARQMFSGFDAKAAKAAASMRRLAKMEQQANLRLKKLAAKEIPAWVGEFRA